MATREIPLNSDIAAFDFKLDLDNRPFTFDIKFNTRMSVWFLSILDDAGVVLLGDIPLFPKLPLIDKYQHDARLPQGVLFLINLVSEDENPTRDNLGTDVVLLYEDA